MSNVTKYFDIYAQDYDQLVTQKYKYAAPQKFSKLIAQFKSTDAPLEALDLGCGTGLISEIIRQHTTANITGADISSIMLEIAKSKGTIDKDICLDVSKNQLPFEDEKFHISVSSGLFEYINDPYFAIEEICRVTKSGGLVAFTTQSSRHFIDHMRRVLGTLFKKLSGKKIQTISEYYHSTDRIFNLLQENNILNIKMETFTAYYHKGPVRYHLFTGDKG